MMKLVSLNTWGGTLNDLLLAFFEAHQHIDFFLLQEVYLNATERTNWDNRGNPNLFIDLQKTLPGHTGFYAPAQDGEYGLAGFIKKGIKIEDQGDVFIHRSRDAMIGTDASTLGRNLQYFKIGGIKPFTLMNFHGLWTGQGKLDTPERIAQSERIVEFARGTMGDFILTGDFNLMPETESIHILEGMNVRNLIKDHGITKTRTSYYKKTPDAYADYTFVTPGIEVKEFRVLPDEVSDHSALYLEFN